MKKPLFSVVASDFRWDTFRCGGKGGQNVNKRSSGVRCTHTPSGAVGKACDERSQHQNRSIAWERCVTSTEFKSWVNQRVFDLTQREEVEKRIEREVSQARVEVFRDGAWRPESEG